MLHSTKGIVFHLLKYSETSVIVKIYTELFGIQSYLLKGARSAKSKVKPGLFQSMTLLDLVVYHKERQSLQSVREVHLAYPYKNIQSDIRKSSVALFINELVYKSIREEEPNPGLFEFLWKSCIDLDETEENVSWFHLFFAMQLMHHLGISPQDNYSARYPLLNMREGHFQAAIPDHPDYLDPATSLLFHRILTACRMQTAENSETAKWRNTEIFQDPRSRSRLLETILLYYQLHLPGFKGMKSHHILHEVLA